MKMRNAMKPTHATQIFPAHRRSTPLRKATGARILAWLLLLGAGGGLATGQTTQAGEAAFAPGALLADAGIPGPADPAPKAEPRHDWVRWLESPYERPSGLWSFEFGVARISDNTPNDYFHLDFKDLTGPGSGLTYNFTIARRLIEFDWKVGPFRWRPQVEMPFRFTLVDQQVGGILPDVNIGVVFRWQDFPWNHFVYMTFAIGGGFSYSSPVWTADLQRHPGLHRSEIKFWLPIEFTVALPKYPNYQITAFVDHQSGGGLLDWGGVDAWGFGFRIVF